MLVLGSMTLALTLVAGNALRQDPEPPDRATVTRALEELSEAFSDGDSQTRLEALQNSSGVLDPDVIAFFAKAIGDRDVQVRRAALGYLGTMRHPRALDSLHSAYRKKKKSLRKDPETFVVLLESMGRHGSPDSIELLAEGALANLEFQVSKARILGLGNIRDRRAVEQLIALITKASRHQVQPHMQHVRMALMVLTGVDQGTSQDAWLHWWNKNKKTLEVSVEPPRLPRGIQRRWDEYWGLRRTVERRQRRSERDDDGGH